MQESSHRQEQYNRLEIYMLELVKKLLAVLEAMRVVEGAETMKFHGIASQELVLNISGHRTVRQPEFEHNV
jgi:hypothetical protein